MLVCSVDRMSHLKHKPLFLDQGADKAENYPNREENQIFPKKDADFCNPCARLNKSAHKDLHAQ